jgi:hemerythrin
LSAPDHPNESFVFDVYSQGIGHWICILMECNGLPISYESDIKPMLYIVWTGKNNLGIPIVDEQHRGIVSAINTFYYSIQEGHDFEALKPTMVFLKQYTQLHFATEESLMQKAGYPDFNRHIAIHKRLVQKTTEVGRASLLHNDADLMIRFLKEWWLGHINQEDRKYAPWVIKTLDIR